MLLGSDKWRVIHILRIRTSQFPNCVWMYFITHYLHIRRIPSGCPTHSHSSPHIMIHRNATARSIGIRGLIASISSKLCRISIESRTLVHSQLLNPPIQLHHIKNLTTRILFQVQLHKLVIRFLETRQCSLEYREISASFRLLSRANIKFLDAPTKTIQPCSQLQNHSGSCRVPLGKCEWGW